MPRRRLTLRSIHIVTTIERRPGVAGYDITTKATAHTSAAEIDLPSSPDCTFLRDPLGQALACEALAGNRPTAPAGRSSSPRRPNA